MPEKIYCYVDESGQHTRGQLFIVSVILASSERVNLLSTCEAIEDRTGKRGKWIKTAYELRAAYIQEVLNNPLFKGCLNFAFFENSQDYPGNTALAIAKAIRAHRITLYKATVIIDGLSHSQERATAVSLRRLGVRLRKLRGARDESNALIRLADSVCGLVSAALEGQPTMKALFDHALKMGFLRDVTLE